jgi:hypothetical protein
MPMFADIFPDNILIQVLGDEVTYIAKGGTSAAIKAVVNYGAQQNFASDSYVPERQVTIDALKSAVPNIAKGSKFVHKGKTYVVDALLDDDGYIVTVSVH